MSYNPSLFAAMNKSAGIAHGIPTDARSYFLDMVTFKPRPYADINEVLAYLNTPDSRGGHFSIYINIAGLIYEYWFKNGVNDSDLQPKIIETGTGAAVFGIVELTIGDPASANPASAPTPAAGATQATLNYKVIPNSEAIFYQGIIVRKSPSFDFSYTPQYLPTTTKYIFNYPLNDGYVLKFNFSVIP